MSNSPKVDFLFQNNNLVQTAPQTGVSFVYAATSKGPVNDPSQVISSVAMFRKIFGEELIPGHPISPIEKALEGGSKLRICRVKGAGSTQGTCTSKITFDGICEIMFDLKYPYDSLGTEVKVAFETSPNGRTFITLSNNEGTLESLYLYAIKNDEGSPLQWDIDGLTKVNNTSQYLKVRVKDLTGNGTITDTVKLRDYLETVTSLTVNSEEGAITSGVYKVPTKDSDYDTDTLDTLADYVEVYQVTFSGINNLIGSDNVSKVHKKWADLFLDLQEYTLYVEVPYSSTNAKGEEVILTDKELSNWAKDHINKVGNSKYIVYFGGGIKYYDTEGNIRNSSCMGAVIGLGDSCASTYGPWKSFAGKRRGILFNAVGPVVANYGSPSRYAQLNELAQNYINMIVVKDTEVYGKQTMLWHLFSSQFKQDSERFLIIVRLNLYLKKTLRPIVEEYIEEPNIWYTWKDMYGVIKPILDDLIEQNAISEYTWIGDQNASSYNDLQVNNEADVRQGKYKAYLKYKDIVTMQEITISIIIDQASKSVSINEE